MRICLEEINRCRPYFISLLGERYGWAPLETDLDHTTELLALFPFLATSLQAGHSVTEMEILHGVLDNPAMTEHSYFYIRDTKLSHALAEQNHAPHEYIETEQRLKEQLANLKEKIRRSGLPVRDQYPTIEALGEYIKQDLLAVLDTQYPEEQTPTPLEAEQNAHHSYAQERSKAYIANPKDIQALNAHLTTPTHQALIVTGESGLGKSALLAYWINQQRQAKPERFIIEHYIGISGDADPVAIIRRIMTEIKHRTEDSAELPSKPEDIIQDFPIWLAKVSERDPLLIIIDGLNQIDSQDGKWLPSFWQHNVKALISVLPGALLEQLQQRAWPIHTLTALEKDHREQLIREWLARYRKKLTPAQSQRIAQAPQTGNPLYLKTVLEELRIFGYFEQLDARINTLLSADNPKALFVLVLERLEKDFGKANVTDIMQALWAARRGLTETELAGITGQSRIDISTYLLAIDAHLAKTSGLINFFHDYLKQAVKQHYLDDQQSQNNAHQQLAHYFKQQELNQRIAEELPWQWQQAEQWEALKDSISAIPMFAVLYNKDDIELLGYWLAIGDQFDAGECYTQALAAWERDNQVEQEELAYVLNGLSYFLAIKCGLTNLAVPLCRRALAICEQVLGSDYLDTAYFINTLAILLAEQGHFVEAESLYRRALAVTEQVLGHDHPRTATYLNNLAVLLADQWHFAESELLNRRALAIREKEFGGDHSDTAQSLNNLAFLLDKQGYYAEAEPLYRQALFIHEQLLGDNNPNTVDIINNLANLLSVQGRSAEAEPLYRRALVIREQVLGFNHPDIASTLRGLANLLSDQGHFAEAELLNRRALDICEEVLGRDHPRTADSLNSLANLLKKQGNFTEAEPLYRRALEINEQVLGCDHPDTAHSLNQLAVFLVAYEDFAEAEPLYRRALAICEQVLGRDHPNTATSLNNLAFLLNKQGHYAEAEPLVRQALAIREQVLGFKHPDTVNSLHGLAILLNNQGHYAEAEPQYRQVLAIREKVLGCDHLDTASSVENLAILLSDQGNLSEAVYLFRRALSIREQVLGFNHPDIASTLRGLANLLSDQGHFAEAELLNRRALDICEEVLVRDHPDTLSSLNNLANLLKKQGNFTEAEPLYRKVLAIREKVLGCDHLDTASSVENLAILLSDQGNLSEAVYLFRRALSIREQVLGLDHADTANNLNNLAITLSILGDYAEAELLYRRSLAINEQVHGINHPATARSLIGMANMLSDQGHFDEAEPLHRRALVINEQVMGSNHPATAMSLNNLANFLCDQGKSAEAEPLYRRALIIYKLVLGSNHPTTANVRHNLMLVLNNRPLIWKQTDFITAIAYAKSIAEITKQTNLSLLSLLLGARSAHLERRLQQPIEALTQHASILQDIANKLAIPLDRPLTPILDQPMPMDDELKALLQEYRKSTLECLVTALIDRERSLDGR